MLADELDYVVGVDTDRDRHALAVVAAPSGRVVAELSVRASARGYKDAVRFADERAPGVSGRWNAPVITGRASLAT